MPRRPCATDGESAAFVPAFLQATKFARFGGPRNATCLTLSEYVTQLEVWKSHGEKPAFWGSPHFAAQHVACPVLPGAPNVRVAVEDLPRLLSSLDGVGFKLQWVPYRHSSRTSGEPPTATPPSAAIRARLLNVSRDEYAALSLRSRRV